MSRLPFPVLLVLLAACGDAPPRSACGVAALAGPMMLLSEFGTPGQTLGLPPESLPPRLVTRMVAGPAFPTIVGRTDSGWVMGVEGTLPPTIVPGFGVLVLAPDASARGILLYEGTPVALAPVLGSVTIESTTVPLLGIQLDPGKYEEPKCPVFPDSVLP
ncbi:MAG TPA: hypothetical protein VFV65_06835 [Gemmatimonadales bacterium]|nr:hypothetical protein [Gemmatimonadales bacterium]